MPTSAGARFLALALALSAIGAASALVTTPALGAAASGPIAEPVDLEVLRGAWVRPDGGYIILIKGIGAAGELEASYFNPNPLPFAKAQASRQGETLRAHFELRAGGYGGSTYELSYDPASDRLTGTYYQAVAKQTYSVYFVRE